MKELYLLHDLELGAVVFASKRFWSALPYGTKCTVLLIIKSLKHIQTRREFEYESTSLVELLMTTIVRFFIDTVEGNVVADL
ncbi:hypothetical protein Tco_0478035 [Tanacetum coccineum]